MTQEDTIWIHNLSLYYIQIEDGDGRRLLASLFFRFVVKQ
jgi:hypothetical protein